MDGCSWTSTFHCRWTPSAPGWQATLQGLTYEDGAGSQHLCHCEALHPARIQDVEVWYSAQTTASSFLFLNLQRFHSRVAPPVISHLQLVRTFACRGSEAIGKSFRYGARVDQQGFDSLQLPKQHGYAFTACCSAAFGRVRPGLLVVWFGILVVYSACSQANY